jgi:L-noviosyl transferase
MLPTLWALRNAGHDVLVLQPARFAALTASAGLPAMTVSDDFYLGDLGTKKANQGGTVADLIDHVLDYYVPATELTVENTVRIAEAWKPDLIMRTGWEYSGPIAAARLGIPTVLHDWGMLAPPDLDPPVAEALRPIHEKWGLPDGVPDPWLIVDNCPPTLQWTTPPPNAIPSTFVPYNGSAVLPDWLLAEPEAPRVLVTLGNVPIMGEHANVLQRTVQALLDFDLDVIIAAGDHLKLDQLGEVPARTRLVHNLPLNQVAPTCSVVINHGGAGSVMASTVAGVPQLALPQMCVQYQHADRIAEVGAGRRLHPEEATVEAIGDALNYLLNDPEPRAVVTKLADEIAARPGLHEVVREISDNLTLLRESADLEPAR